MVGGGAWFSASLSWNTFTMTIDKMMATITHKTIMLMMQQLPLRHPPSSKAAVEYLN
jgi:hypothetical protein